MSYADRRSYRPEELTERARTGSRTARLVRGLRLYFAGPIMFWAVLWASDSVIAAFAAGVLVMLATHAELERNHGYLSDLELPLPEYLADFVEKTRFSLPLTLAGLFSAFHAGTWLRDAAGIAGSLPELFATESGPARLLLEGVMVAIVGDLLLYWHHRAAHSLGEGVLWRMHAVHHSIPYFTAAHGARAHPLDTFVTYGWYGAAGALLGASVEGTFCGGAMAIFFMSAHHANTDTSIGILRHLFVTTEMHRWHHNVDPAHARNYSSILTAWDVLFGTHHQPRRFDGRMGVDLFPREFPESFADQARLVLPSRYRALKDRNGTS